MEESPLDRSVGAPQLSQKLYEQILVMANNDEKKAEKIWQKLKKVQENAQKYSQGLLEIDALLKVGKEKKIDKIRFKNKNDDEILFSRAEIEGSGFIIIEIATFDDKGEILGSKTTSIEDPDEEHPKILVKEEFINGREAEQEEWHMPIQSADLEFFASIKEYFELLSE